MREWPAPKRKISPPRAMRVGAKIGGALDGGELGLAQAGEELLGAVEVVEGGGHRW
jgi:hypothetical protein